MNDIEISINSDAVDRSLDSLQASLEDESCALRTIGDDLREMIAQQFATEGAAGGTPWAPLAPSTLRKKRDSRSGILDVTGALLASLVDAGAAGHVEESDGQQLIFGTALPYALFHQTGTRRLPARPIIALTGDSTDRWLEFFRASIEGKTVLLGARELGGKK